MLFTLCSQCIWCIRWFSTFWDMRQRGHMYYGTTLYPNDIRIECLISLPRRSLKVYLCYQSHLIVSFNVVYVSLGHGFSTGQIEVRVRSSE